MSYFSLLGILQAIYARLHCFKKKMRHIHIQYSHITCTSLYKHTFIHTKMYNKYNNPQLYMNTIYTTLQRRCTRISILYAPIRLLQSYLANLLAIIFRSNIYYQLLCVKEGKQHVSEFKALEFLSVQYIIYIKCRRRKKKGGKKGVSSRR